MSAYEAHHPILSSPFHEPNAHGHSFERELPEQRFERRPAKYCYPDPDDTPITFTSLQNPHRKGCYRLYCIRHAK